MMLLHSQEEMCINFAPIMPVSVLGLVVMLNYAFRTMNAFRMCIHEVCRIVITWSGYPETA